MWNGNSLIKKSCENKTLFVGVTFKMGPERVDIQRNVRRWEI